jgi:hypothetical protein
MELDESVQNLDDALARGEFTILFCNCSIKYSGRAESFLDYGDRVIIIKQDKGVLIHQPENGNPINYIRPPAEVMYRLETKQDDDIDHIAFIAQHKEDRIEVSIIEVYNMTTRRLEDGQKQELSGSEKEMSDMIKDTPTVISEDFIPLSREEHTKYGFIDVFGHLGDGTLAVIECKRYTAGLAAATQLRRYVEKIKSLKGIEKVVGILAAPAITANANAMLADWNCSFCRVEPPKRHVRKRRSQKSMKDFFG